MNRRTSVIALGLLLAALMRPVAIPAQSKAEVALQAAIETDTVQRDCRKAIKEYQKLASEKDRRVAVTALMHMAGCHRRLGDAEAGRIYERVVKEFQDQPDAVADARARLHAMAVPSRTFQNRLLLPSDDIDELSVDVSSDGRFLATIRFEEPDKQTVVVRDLETGVIRAVSDTFATRDNIHMLSARFSLDGKQLVYQWCNSQCELRVIDLQGRGIPKFQTLMREEWLDPLDWTPDSTSIVVFRTFNEREADIAVIDVRSGRERVLQANPGPYARLSVSPDGRFVARDRQARAGDLQWDLFIQPFSGGAERRVMENPADDRLVGWSPDGRYLLFTSNRNTGTYGLYALAVIDGRPDGEPRLLYSDLGRRGIHGYGLTKAGSLIYMQAQVPNSYQELHVAPIDLSTGIIGPSTTIGSERVGSDTSPVWSSDGSRLAYLSTANARVQRALVVIRDMASGRSRELRPNLRQLTGLRWSPDGTAFLTTGQNDSKESGIFRIDATTGEPTLVVSGGNQPAWARDGVNIFFRRSSSQDGVAFVTRNLATGVEREIVRRQGMGNMGVSPDGRYFSTGIVDEATDTRTIVAIPTSGGDPIVLRVNKPSTGGAGLWLPDSQGLISFDGSRYWRVTFDGRETAFADDLSQAKQTALSPDGTRVAFVKEVKAEQNDNPGVRVLENFLPSDAGKEQPAAQRR